MKIIFAICLFFLCTYTGLADSAHHDHRDIYKTINSFLDSRLSSSPDISVIRRIDELDARLALAQCDKPLQAFSHQQQFTGSRISVGVKCEGSRTWSIYLPVEILRFAAVYVAARPIAKGETIAAGDIQRVERNINQIRGDYFSSADDVIGKIAKHSIRAGNILINKQLRSQTLIKAGDEVDILANGRGLEIRMNGRALSAGAKGDIIKIKNTSSQRLIEAEVIDKGLVAVDL